VPRCSVNTNSIHANSIEVKPIPYSFDMLNRHSCKGWCYNRLFKSNPVTLSFYRGKALVGTARCEQYRRDLVELNLHPTGLCGFEVAFSPTPKQCDGLALVVRASGYPIPLTVISADQIVHSVDSVAKTIFFIHVPKSAGTSFNNFMLPYFASGQTAIHIEGTELAGQKDIAYRHYVSGHLSLAQVKEIYHDLDEIDLYTILREPYRHLHSHFSWVKGIADPKTTTLFKDHTERVQNLSLKLNRLNFSDHRELEKVVSGFGGFELEYFDNLQTRYLLDYRVVRVAHEDFQCALENKRRFKAIGITENLQSFSRRVCLNHNLTYVKQKVNYNPSGIKPLYDLSDPTLRKILQPLVKFDLPLYDSIKQSW
jgi:hypothetical protein